MEALRQAEAKLTVSMHPSNAADVDRAVAQQLSTLLYSYEERFDGVLLPHEFSLEGVKSQMNGLIPYFGVPVHAKLLLFSPQPDMILEGKVEMLGKESIHVIVLGLFSAAIMSNEIPEKFKFKRRGGSGKFISQSEKLNVIKKGSMIRFSVKSYTGQCETSNGRHNRHIHTQKAFRRGRSAVTKPHTQHSNQASTSQQAYTTHSSYQHFLEANGKPQARSENTHTLPVSVDLTVLCSPLAAGQPSKEEREQCLQRYLPRVSELGSTEGESRRGREGAAPGAAGHGHRRRRGACVGKSGEKGNSCGPLAVE
uniref:Uncharacterized protein n=1 Tax=Avena sativa TaxID=4498 RepID=A0ACD5W5I9_AVESA